MTSQERRKSYRVNCNLNVSVTGDNKEIRAESIDLSETGFKLRSYRRFTPRTHYELNFTLGSQTTEIKCLASVVWVNKIDDPDIFLTGFIFSELSEEDLFKIHQFLEEKGLEADDV